MDTLTLDLIRTDGGTQPRAALNELVIDEYAEDMASGVTFPPVVVFYDGTAYWLADGFHRHYAAQRAGLTALPVDTRQGTQRDAVLFSLSANAAHGLRRTNADKRRVVSKMLADEAWAKLSDHEIGRRCAVTQPFVSKLRAALTDNGYQSPGEAEELARQEATITRGLNELLQQSFATDSWAEVIMDKLMARGLRISLTGVEQFPDDPPMTSEEWGAGLLAFQIIARRYGIDEKAGLR